MSAEHKRPLVAFIAVTVLCALFLGHAIRSEAIVGVLRALPGPVSVLGHESRDRVPAEPHGERAGGDRPAAPQASAPVADPEAARSGGPRGERVSQVAARARTQPAGQRKVRRSGPPAAQAFEPPTQVSSGPRVGTPVVPTVPTTATTPVTTTTVTPTPVVSTPVTRTPGTRIPFTRTPVTRTPVTRTPLTRTPARTPVSPPPATPVTPPARPAESVAESVAEAVRQALQQASAHAAAARGRGAAPAVPHAAGLRWGRSPGRTSGPTAPAPRAPGLPGRPQVPSHAGPTPPAVPTAPAVPTPPVAPTRSGWATEQPTPSAGPAGHGAGWPFGHQRSGRD